MKGRQLPESEIYERGLLYWPYRLSQEYVFDMIVRLAPRDGRLLDIMCGPGNLLGRINRARPDLKLFGVDIESRFVQYGRKTYPQISFKRGDVLNWKTRVPFDVIVCTGSLHHIHYDLQEKAIARIASLAASCKFVIISDCYVNHYTNENDRKKVAAKLGYEYLQETIHADADDEVIGWTMDILWNDVFGKEFKTSLQMRLPLLEKYFRRVRTQKIWPSENIKFHKYGDYVHICYL